MIRDVFVSLRGRLLVATPALGDPNFDRTVVLMLEHTEEGAVGLVLNRPSGTDLDEAGADWEGWDLLAARPPVVFVGGPVSRTAVICVARLGDGGQLEGEIADGAWFVGDANPGDALTPDPETLWEDVLRRQGGRLAMFALCPSDPSQN